MMLRFLKISIAIMSVLIVVGVSIIIYELVHRAQQTKTNAPLAIQPIQDKTDAPLLTPPVISTITLDKRDRIEQILSDNNHLILHIRNQRDRKIVFYSKETGEKTHQYTIHYAE